MRPIGIGIIGMGWMGQVHGRAYRSLPLQFPESDFRPRLVAAADPVPARLEGARQMLEFERATPRWQDVIDDPAVEALSVTVPNNLHVEIVTAAAERGKHVLCEKPVGRSPQETAAVARAAERAGILSLVGFNYRWAPLVMHCRELIRQGVLGEITHYRGRFLVDYGSNPDGALSWRFQREVAGSGTLGDLMSHVVDMSHSLIGPIRRVSSTSHRFIGTRPLPRQGEGTHFSVVAGGPRGEVTNEDYVAALVEWSCGARGTLEVCRVAKGPGCEMSFELNGTRGSAKWNYERMNELTLFLPDTAGHDAPMTIQAGPQHPLFEKFYPGPAQSMSYQDLKTIEAWQFLNSVAAGRQTQPGFVEALRVAEVEHAMTRSWSSGSWEAVAPLPE